MWVPEEKKDKPGVSQFGKPLLQENGEQDEWATASVHQSPSLCICMTDVLNRRWLQYGSSFVVPAPISPNHPMLRLGHRQVALQYRD
jgi:hypothetical protein